MRRLACLCLLCLAVLAWSPPLGAEMVWERYQGQLPPDAVKAGFVPEADLYVCRGNHRDGVQVGKLFNGRCNIGWGGHEISLGDFEILVDKGGPRWLAHGQDFPRDAVAGGRAAGADLYACRVFFRDGIHLGEVVDRRCRIGWGDREILAAPYEVLSGRGLKWIPAKGGELPPGAVGGGMVRDGETYVCRGKLEDGVHLGKWWRGRCNVGHRGQEILLSEFEVLTRPGGYTWEKAGAGLLGGGCLVGGRAQGQAMCVCRGRYRDGLHIGRAVAGRCHIGWGGQEVALDEFEVLVAR